MKQKSKAFRKTIALLSVMIMLVGVFGGCSKKDQPSVSTPSNTNSTSEKEDNGKVEEEKEPEKLPPYKISIMAPFASDEHDQNPHRQKIYQMIEEYTNTEIEFIFYPDTLYYEKVPLVLAAGDMPSIMVANKDATIGNAGESGDIWEVGPYLEDYPNLSTIHEVAIQNASFNGRLYGVPRARAVGRNGAGYRLDWLENLGLKEPKTIDDFYEMLVQFTKNDPDGNGKNDTIGLAVTSYGGPWDNMQIWFGAPNGWGEQDGKLIPTHMTKEYDEALKFFRKIYSEGLVNQDFDTYDPGKWDDMLRGGIAGATVDVVDRFARNQEYFDREGIPAKTQIVGGFEGPQGLRLLPTAGYAGLLIFSKEQIKTEDELKRALDFMDKMSDAEMLNLIEWGVEGIEWDYNEEGYAIRYTEEEKPEMGTNPRTGLNQFISYWVHPDQTPNRIVGEPMSEIRVLQNEVQASNEPYCIANPGASYFSETMAVSGNDLNDIINQGRTDYIKGVIDDVGLQAVKDQWLKSGGQKVIDEVNKLYKK